MGDYWILESTKGYARIHRGRCAYCKYGKGPKATYVTGAWQGPFPTYAEVLFVARRTGSLSVTDCKRCTPRGY